MSDYNTSTAAYRNSAEAHREEFLTWLTAGNATEAEAVAEVVAKSETPEDLANECARDGWFAKRTWFDRETLVAVVRDLMLASK